LRAQGVPVGNSMVEETAVQAAREILRDADVEDVKVVLPSDHVCAERPAAGLPTKVVTGSVPAGLMGLDIGPATVEEFAAILAGAGTVLWNGPLGVFETPPFDRGTEVVAHALAELGRRGAYTVLGGGETVAAAGRAGVTNAIGHVSTGGGASLELLAGKTLPGLAVLERPAGG
ncbi:MAG TPA: phosphoglycerate kinase, partial [Thermoanaerobaculia bacterium]|nr:phosphoglycerate kinase [Thermoanaerobaculia bacterium]